jgi:uncharacterized membrane protein
MKVEHFLSHVDHERIVAAIASAEKNTSGEIRVWISHRRTHDALGAARKRFQKSEMHKTSRRNAVLIFLVPRTQVFAILGDTAIDEKCGASFWKEITAQLSTDLKREPITEALVAAIQKIAAALATHFPPTPGDRNELPDDILRD